MEYESRYENKFLARKKALIDRDPLTGDFLKKLQAYKSQKNGYHQFKELQDQLEKKWNVFIYPTIVSYKGESKIYHYPRTPGMEQLSDTEIEQKPFEIYHFYEQKKQPVAEITSLKDVDFYSREKLLIQFDLSLLNKSTNTEKLIKDATWRIIKRALEERKKTFTEPEELTFIYRCRSESTFNKYLRWYDIHTTEKFGFRLIAYLENQYKQDPIKRNDLLDRVKKMPKSPKIGASVRGEDKVEKGIKLIYQAIHRKPYSKKSIEFVTDEYNCLQHGNDCPATCAYLKDFYNKIKRNYPDN